MRTSVVLLLAALSLGAAAAAPAEEPSPQVTDIAGDANGINGQVYNAAALGQAAEILRDAIWGGDPFNEGQPTPVGSYAPADIRELRLATEYEAVPVGEDGIDYRPTALLITIRTEEPAAAQVETMELKLMAKMTDPNGSGTCNTSFFTTVGTGGELGSVSWYRFSDCLGGLFSGTNAAWQASRGGDPRSITMRIPRDSLTGPERAYLEEEALVSFPQALSQTHRGIGTYDVTLRGTDFWFGEDMPADVPCTRGCP